MGEDAEDGRTLWQLEWCWRNYRALEQEIPNMVIPQCLEEGLDTKQNCWGCQNFSRRLTKPTIKRILVVILGNISKRVLKETILSWRKPSEWAIESRSFHLKVRKGIMGRLLCLCGASSPQRVVASTSANRTPWEAVQPRWKQILPPVGFSNKRIILSKHPNAEPSESSEKRTSFTRRARPGF